MTQCKCSPSVLHLVKQGLVQGSILPLQLVDFLIELGFYMSTLDLQSLQGMDSALYGLGQQAGGGGQGHLGDGS